MCKISITLVLNTEEIRKIDKNHYIPTNAYSEVYLFSRYLFLYINGNYIYIYMDI